MRDVISELSHDHTGSGSPAASRSSTGSYLDHSWVEHAYTVTIHQAQVVTRD